MTSAERRAAILEQLEKNDKPLSATALAERFHVSRQIIVGDVALLRAAGRRISATPRGYIMGEDASGITSVLACTHQPKDMGRELNLIVDYGGEVLDVIVEHLVYGQLTGQLQLRSRHDVAQFLKKAEGASLLSVLTDGIHLHTIRCPDEGTMLRVTDALKQEGFLLEE